MQVPQQTNKNEPQLYEEFGLKAAEYAKILEILGREPNMTELGLFAVMWSEHCSYKSTRKWLKNLPTQAPWVICGPGENAGVIDIGDGQAAIFKMESHNHPSFIEPFQGAATGVGGILRDVFTMGARPVALLNALRFGEPGHPKTRHLVSGVVSGIGFYGNCVGVPTIGGECNFHPSYNGNILVNAMAVGIADKNRIFYSAAGGVGNPVVYVGSKTGRDGIHGATMASASFTAGSEEKRPTVQVGDPFTEKLLIEACLELMATDAIVAIQDMGAAGLSSSSLEMAAKGSDGINLGVELELEKVPTREEAMSAYEIMLSESQERMLVILKPGKEDEARAIFEKWELDFAVIGRITDTGRLVVKMNGHVEADLPVLPLATEAPIYDRPWKIEKIEDIIEPEFILPPADMEEALLKMLASPNLCSKRWIWEQYDHMVMGDTVARPGGDASLVRVHGTKKALAISADCTPRYCNSDPVTGGKQAVAECWRNIIAVGAKPLAITNCLNFGNPERKEIMGQIVGCLEGMGEACKALDFPVVSGNVSLYNETGSQSVFPTPAIGGVGLISDIDNRVGLALTAEGNVLILIGETKGHLGDTVYCQEICGCERAAPPEVCLVTEKKNGLFALKLAEEKLISACHDISDGGLAVAIAEMAMAGKKGAEIKVPELGVPLHAWLFGEDQARYIVECDPRNTVKILSAAKEARVTASVLGMVTGTRLSIGDSVNIEVSELSKAHESWLPEYMA